MTDATDPAVPALTADILIAELDRRLAEGRLSISAHAREVKDVRAREKGGRKLPGLPKHDSPKWMVKADQEQAEKKAAKAKLSSEAGRQREAVERARRKAARRQIEPLAKKLQAMVDTGSISAAERARRIDAAVTARLSPQAVPKSGGFWKTFDRISDSW